MPSTQEKGLIWNKHEKRSLTFTEFESYNLTWNLIEALFDFQQSEKKTISVKVGSYLLQLHGRNAKDIYVNTFTIDYDPAFLQLENLKFHNTFGIPGLHLASLFDLQSISLGRIVLKSKLPRDDFWTGLVAKIKFKVLKNGNTVISTS